MTQSATTYRLIRWTAVSISVAFLSIWLYTHVSQSVYVSLNFDGFIADGPFQLFNPLRRIAAGQTAGIDFQFFHGLGVPFLYYPLFALFGKTIFASELSRNLTSLFCFVTSLFIFGFVITGKNLQKTIFFLVSAICLLEFLAFDGIDSFGHPLATAGNSLLGARATFPIIVFAILLSDLKLTYKAVATGLALGASCFFGTEHGLALITSFLALHFLYLAKSFFIKPIKLLAHNSVSWKFLGLSLISFALSLVILYSLFSRFSAIGQILKYNLVEVPSDQFWYFGVLPNDSATSLTDFTKLAWQGISIFILIFIWLVINLYTNLFRRKNPVEFEQVTIDHMLCYGLVSCASCLGMLESGYLLPMIRIFVLIILLLIFRKDYPNLFVAKLKEQMAFRHALSLGLLAITILSFLATLTFISVKRLPPISYLPFGPFPAKFSISWENHLKVINESVRLHTTSDRDLTIWSTYAGLLESNNKVFHPREDYIIHALGKARRSAYTANFHLLKPDYVQTLRRSHFITYTKNRDYEQWLRNTSWDFYEDVINNYDIEVTTDRSIIWKKRDTSWNQANNNFAVIPFAAGKDTLDIPLSKPIKDYSLVVVKVKYQISNPWKRIPFLGGLPRYLVKLENVANDLPISLPPYEEEVRFPLMLSSNCNPKLLFKTQSLVPGAKFVVTEVSYKMLELSNKQALFLHD